MKMPYKHKTMNMKRAVLYLLAALAAMSLQAQQPVAPPPQAPGTCSVTVTGDFDSECIYDYKDDITDEYPVTEVAVMDMNGRRIAVFAETATFSVEGLPSGAYIVRVRTAGEGEEKVTYHKLIKK